VLDRRSARPLENAPVLVQGGGKLRNTVTDAQGRYRFFLPPGTYTVRSYFPLFHGAKVTGAPVERGAFLELDLSLPRIDEERDVSVEELEIPYRADTTTAAAQDQLRQASSGIGEGMGAKQMSQAGASDAGSAAARVVGVTIDSSQLVIRGLGGRYTRVLLNGVAVPSIDPDEPGVDLDLFPTSIIDSLTISKTFLPDIPADFAGGVMEIKSISFPRKFTLELAGGLGFNSQSTFRQRLDYRGGKYDALGFDDGRRELPKEIARDVKLRAPTQAYPTQEDVNVATRAMRNSWQYHYKSALPRMAVEMTVGDSLNLSGRKRFGYLLTAGYEYDSLRRVGISRPSPSYYMGKFTKLNDYATEVGVDEVQLSALGTASLDLGVDHSMTVLSMFNRIASDETSLKVGTAGGEAEATQEKWQLRYLPRTLWFNQLFGDHRNLFGTRLRLRWAGFQSYGERDEPDRRNVSYEARGGTNSFKSAERFYSNLDQKELGANASLRFPLWSQGWGTLGGSTQRSTRDFTNRRFRMVSSARNHDATVLRLPIEDLMAPENIGPAMEILEETRPNDSYQSKQVLYSGYLMLETPVHGPLSLAGGVRTEVFHQIVESRSPFPSEMAKVEKTDRTDTDYLPGAALKYQLSSRMLLRGAYGVTVARPLVRELAPYQYYDFLRERNVEGNPALRRTSIQNADLRWEWFWGEGEILAISAFYKAFKDPIELTVIDPLTSGTQFRNGTSARNLGAEFEMRVNGGRLSRWLRNFDLDGNFALVRSRIELPKDLLTVRGSRPLVGQSPYVANLSLKFFDPRRGLAAAVVYNVIGPRIAEAASLSGTEIPPDIEEQAFHSLDVVGSAQIGRHLKLKLKVRNLLAQSVEFKQADFLLQRTEPGISASLGLALSY
jgi:outer membrane receptor protein involved in Fe transport